MTLITFQMINRSRTSQQSDLDPYHQIFKSNYLKQLQKLPNRASSTTTHWEVQQKSHRVVIRRHQGTSQKNHHDRLRIIRLKSLNVSVWVLGLRVIQRREQGKNL